jgi:hypothetical protein
MKTVEKVRGAGRPPSPPSGPGARGREVQRDSPHMLFLHKKTRCARCRPVSVQLQRRPVYSARRNGGTVRSRHLLPLGTPLGAQPDASGCSHQAVAGRVLGAATTAQLLASCAQLHAPTAWPTRARSAAGAGRPAQGGQGGGRPQPRAGGEVCGALPTSSPQGRGPHFATWLACMSGCTRSLYTPTPHTHTLAHSLPFITLGCPTWLFESAESVCLGRAPLTVPVTRLARAGVWPADPHHL